MKLIYMRNSQGAREMMRDIFDLLDSAASDFVFLISDIQELLKDKNSKRTWLYLQDKGFVENLDGQQAKLTEMAKMNLLAEIVARRKPDGQYRLITFDIPEKLRIKRDVLRRHLRELGFRQWQKSVWMSDLPCEDLVEMVFESHEVGRFARLFVGKAWDNSKSHDRVI